MTHNRRLQRALRDAARQEIPDDMASLWPAIQAQLQPRRTRRVLHATRLGWITVIVVLSLMVSAGTYAFYQLGLDDDPGLREIDDDLITPINQSVTVDGVTVTLDWAYADEHRIALAYHATRTGANGEETIVTSFEPGRLTYGPIGDFPPMSGAGGGGSEGVLFEASANFDASLFPRLPDELALHYQITLSELEAVPGVEHFGGGSGGGGGGGGGLPPHLSGEAPGGGGGGGGGGSSFGPVPEGTTLPEVGSIGPFEFAFTVPLERAMILEPGQSVETNGVTMTLTRASITPSMSRFDLCYTVDVDQPWGSVASLDYGGEAPLTSAGTSMIWNQDERLCFQLGFLSPYDREPGQWTLHVERLEIPAQLTPQEIQVAPDDVTTRFAEKIEGPWVFVIEVPGS